MTLPRALAVILLVASSLAAQQQQKKQASRPAQIQAYHDELGFTCAQILALPSADYIAKIVAIDDSNADGQLRGIRNYGRCYDERTTRLTASLTRRGIGPKKPALANLADLERKLDAFTATVLADVATDAPSEPVKKTYAELYAKQFRYEFYESFEPKTTSAKAAAKPAPTHPASTAASPSAAAPPGTTAKPKTSAPSNENLPAAPAKSVDLGDVRVPKPTAPAPNNAAPPQSSTPATDSSAGAPTPGAKDQSSSADAGAQASALAVPPVEIDPFTKAKNHFGELLGVLPPEKIHEVHSAFGQLFDANPVSEDLKVDVYKYAIFLLEGPKDQPFAPPPF